MQKSTELDTEVVENLKKSLKKEFQDAENNLLAALNRIDNSNSTDAGLVELRRKLMQVRHDCDQHGVEVETLWEFAQRQQAIDLANVRRYAEEQSGKAPMLTYALRQKVAWSISIVMTILFVLEGITASRIFLALISCLVIFLILEIFIAEFFPTPSIRIGRRACELEVDVSDLWPPESNELKDYRYGYTSQQWRRNRRGLNGRIRAR